MPYESIPTYNILTDFSDDEANLVAGRSTVRTANLDTEHVNIKAVLDALSNNLLMVQRTDGRVKDAFVEPHGFSASALALIASTFTPLGDWATATAYVVGNVVEESGNSYVCVEAHTSGTFATDHAAEKWVILATLYEAVDETDTDTTKDKLVSNNLMKTLEAWRNLMTTRGDMVYRDASGNARLAKGGQGSVLGMNANDPEWQNLLRYEAVTADPTVVAADQRKMYVCSGASFACTLASAASLGAGFVIGFIHSGTSLTQVYTVTADGSETFDLNGQTTLKLSVSGDRVVLVSDGTNWRVVSKSLFVGFMAAHDAAQSITASTWTKATNATEVFDPQGDYDNATNYRYIPNIPGIYQVTAQTQFGTLADTKNCRSAIYKNGSIIAEGREYVGNISTPSPFISRPVEMNGTTDYLEHYVWQGDTVARNLVNGEAYTFLSAYLIG